MSIFKSSAFLEIRLIEHGPWKDTQGLSLICCRNLTRKFSSRE